MASVEFRYERETAYIGNGRNPIVVRTIPKITLQSDNACDFRMLSQLIGYRFYLENVRVEPNYHNSKYNTILDFALEAGDEITKLRDLFETEERESQ